MPGNDSDSPRADWSPAEGGGRRLRRPDGGRWLSALVLAGCVVVAIGAIRHFHALGRPLHEEAIGICAGGAVAWLARSAWLRAVAPARWVSLALGVFVASRLAVLVLVPSVPVSDFAKYFELARHFARGEAVPAGDFAPWGYPLALAPVLALCGAHVPTAQVFNVVMGALALVLIYKLTRSVYGPTAAKIAALLFVLWPAQVMLTPVLASEHVALVLALAFLLCIVKTQAHSAPGRAPAGAPAQSVPAPPGEERTTAGGTARSRNLVSRAGSGTRQVAMTLLAGVAAALSVAVRPAAGVLIVAGLLTLGSRNESRRRRLMLAVLLCAAFGLTYGGYLGAMKRAVHATPPTAAGWNLLVGTNSQHDGMWNQDDVSRFFSFPSLEHSNRFARQEAWRRIRSDPGGFVRLMGRKVNITWTTAGYGVYWSVVQGLSEEAPERWARSHVNGLFAWAQFYHSAILVLAVGGLLRAVRSSPPRATTLLVLGLLAGTALHSVFEAQNRYQYVFFVSLLVIASSVLAPPPPRPANPGATG